MLAFYTINVRSCNHPGTTFPNRKPLVMQNIQLMNLFSFGFSGCQGLAFDGETLFFAATDLVASVKIKNLYTKDTPEYTILKRVAPAIPQELKDQGYWHIGDLVFFNGSLVVPIEDYGWTKPALMSLDPDSLLPIMPIIEVPQQKHLPWVAIQHLPGHAVNVMYSSESLRVNEIVRREFPSMKILPSIFMPAEMKVVQGGAFDARGILWVSTSLPDAYGCNIYAVNVSDTAEQQPLYVAYSLASSLGIAAFLETEGMTFAGTNLLINFNFWYFFKGMITIPLP
jgi:hypothetical protein